MVCVGVLRSSFTGGGKPGWILGTEGTQVFCRIRVCSQLLGHLSSPLRLGLNLGAEMTHAPQPTEQLGLKYTLIPNFGLFVYAFFVLCILIFVQGNWLFS